MKRANLKTTLFCAFVLYSFAAYTQDNIIDSLQKVLQTQKEDTSKVNILNELSRQLTNQGNYQDAMEQAKQGLSLSERINFKRGKATFYKSMGWIYQNQGNYSEARKFYLKALKIREELGNKPGTASSYLSIAITYHGEENFVEALKNYYIALKLYEELRDKESVASSLQYIGIVYYHLGNDSEALKNFFASLKIREEIGYTHGIAINYNEIARIYYRQSKYSEALEKRFAALKIYQGLGEQKYGWGIGRCYVGIGNIYKKQGELAFSEGDKSTSKKKFSEALKYYLASLKIWEEVENKGGVADLYVALGNIYVKFKKLSEAKDYLEKGLQFSKSIRYKGAIRDSYKSLSTLDSMQGNFKQAYEHLKMYILYRDSLVNDESVRKSEGYKMQYEFEKKENQIKLLSTENKLKTALAGREGQRKKMAYAGIGIILLSGGYGFYRYRRHKRLQSQQTILNERLRISRELHDEVGATLSGISMYSHLAKEQIKTAQKEEVERSLNIMQQSSGEMVNKLNDIVWLINPEQDTLQKLVERLEEYATDMAAIKNMKVKITVPDKIAELSLPVESRRNIYLFCKEAINNAVKYSQGSLLELSIKEMDGKLEFSVSDNGKGFDAVLVRRGNGLENMQKRADEIGAKLVLQSKESEGASVSLQCRVL